MEEESSKKGSIQRIQGISLYWLPAEGGGKVSFVHKRGRRYAARAFRGKRESQTTRKEKSGNVYLRSRMEHARVSFDARIETPFKKKKINHLSTFISMFI